MMQGRDVPSGMETKPECCETSGTALDQYGSISNVIEQEE